MAPVNPPMVEAAASRDPDNHSTRPSCASSAAPGGKRARVELADGEFRLSFGQCAPLFALVDIVSKLLEYIEIKVLKDAEGFSGIKISKIDEKHVCYIVAKLECDVQVGPGPPPVFCVQSNTLVPCLKAVAAHYTVELKSDPDSSNLLVVASEGVGQSYSAVFSVPTLVREEEAPTRLMLDRYLYNVELDLGVLRNIVRNASLLEGDQLCISLRRPKVPLPDLEYTIVSLKANGRASQEHQFHSIIQAGDPASTRVIKLDESSCDELPPVSEFETVYSGSFQVKYLQRFLAGMERHIITMRISPGKPLYIKYHLGSEASFVCLVLSFSIPD